MSIDNIEYTKSCGNIFKDLGLDNPELREELSNLKVANKKLEAQLAKYEAACEQAYKCAKGESLEILRQALNDEQSGVSR